MSKPKTAISPNKPLTRKQRAFVNHLVENPKDSATQAVEATYDKTTYKAARAIASENLTKPNIITELSKHNKTVETTLLNTVHDWGNSEKLGQRSLAVDTAKYIHDKIHGKAKQSVELSSTVVSVSLDLSSTPT